MIFKFLKPKNIFRDILSSCKGTFVEMFVSQNENEKYCYVLLSENQVPYFEKQFGNDGIKLSKDAEEYPGSNHSMKDNRIENFIRVAAPNY